MRRAAATILIVAGLAFVLAGCAPAAPDAAAQKAACIQNMLLIHTEMELFRADAGEYPPLADVLAKMKLKCPSGGTYAFDPATGTLSCSIHGPYKP